MPPSLPRFCALLLLCILMPSMALASPSVPDGPTEQGGSVEQQDPAVVASGAEESANRIPGPMVLPQAWPGGDTVLRMEQSVPIPITYPPGRSIRLLEPVLEWDSGTNRIEGKHHGLIPFPKDYTGVEVEFLPLKELSIAIDGPTDKDHNDMRVKGVLYVSYKIE